MLHGLSGQLNDFKRALAEKESQLQITQYKLKKLQNLLPNENNSLMMSSETDEKKISVIISNFYECCHIAKEHGCRLSISNRGEEVDVSVIAINRTSSLKGASKNIEDLIRNYEVQEVKKKSEKRLNGKEKGSKIENHIALYNSDTSESSETVFHMSTDSHLSQILERIVSMPKPTVSRYIGKMPAVEASRAFEHFILFNVELDKHCLCSIFSFIQDRLAGVNLKKSKITRISRNIDHSLRNVLNRESFLQHENMWKTYEGTIHTFSFFKSKKVRYASVAICNKHIIAATVGKNPVQSRKSMKRLMSTALFYFINDPNIISHRPKICTSANDHDTSTLGIHRRLLYCMFRNLACLHGDLTTSTLFSTIALFALHVEFHFEHFKNFS